MKIENQNASEVPIFLKFSINSKKQKTKNKTKKHRKQKWNVDFIFQRLLKSFG